MKIIMYGVKDVERPFIEEWVDQTGNEVRAVTAAFDKATIDLAKGYDGVSIQQTTPLGDEKFYEELASMGIKQISTRTAGYDLIDLEACKNNNIVVTNVTVYSPRAIAEMGLTQAMYLLRNIGKYQDRMSTGDFRWSPDLISNEIYNQTVGIVGLGNIGGALAQIFKALGATVIAYDPAENIQYAPFVQYTSLENVLTQADIISLHTPLFESTKNMIAKPQFEMMKNNAILLNMARGGLVNTQDLIEALKTHQIAAAGLDTLADEASFFNHQVKVDTLPADYLELSKMDNVLITPHVAFFTKTAIKNMVKISLDDVVKVVNGEKSKDEVH